MNHGLQTNAQDMISAKLPVLVSSLTMVLQVQVQIRIRGGSSLNASNDPNVIDGLAMDNTNGVQGLSNPLSVNPNDIESFTVLKGCFQQQYLWFLSF